MVEEPKDSALQIFMYRMGGAIITLLCTCVIIAPFLYYIHYPIARAAIGVIAMFFTIPACYASFTFTPWVPTPNKDFTTIFALANLKPGEKFYDLGCGDGRIVAFISGKTEAQCIGIEYSPFHFLLAKIRCYFTGNKNLQIKLGDLFKEDLSLADAVYVYACPHSLENKFAQKLTEELKTGARVISKEHVIAGLHYQKKVIKDGIYCYKI